MGGKKSRDADHPGPDNRQAVALSNPLDALAATLPEVARGDNEALRGAYELLKDLRAEISELTGHQTELLTLHEISRELASILDLDQLLSSILDHSVRLVQAERGLLLLYAPEKDDFTVAMVRGADEVKTEKDGDMAISRKLIRHVLQTRQPLITTDAQDDDRFANSSSIVAFQIRSVLAVPLAYQAELIGVIYLDTRIKRRTFRESDLALLSAMANQAAVAIHIARLYDDLKARNQELARALEELRTTQEELVRTERLSAIGRMASMIVHDIKGPLTTIKGYAQLLGTKDLTDEQRASFSQIITEAVDSFAGMTQEILDYARGEQSLTVRPFDLEEFLSDLRQFIARDFAERGIEVRLDIDCRGEIRGDRQKLWRAIYNIAKNAAEAMETTCHCDDVLCITARQAGDWAELVISDTGPGIPPEIQPKVLQPFATYGKLHGTGLGLSIARSIIEAHHGRLSLASEVGKGTSVTIRLPLEAKAQ